MDPSNFPSQISPPQMYNFMQLPSNPPPWVNAMQRVQGQLPKSSEQMKKILEHKLEAFWRHQKIEMYQRKSGAVYKQRALPLARIKKIMKTDDEVKMISGDTPELFAKACELFILELTLRSFVHTEDQMRLTIRRCDIANAIYNADEFDFLTDIVPPDAKEEFAPDFDLEANLVSLRSTLEPQQFIILDQDPEEDGNYIISGPPPPL